MASNESKHPWLDEGFAEYTCTLIENSILGVETSEPMKRHFNRYFDLALSGKEQPMSTHADRFAYNKSYSISTYSKGALVLAQLRYIIGEDNFWESLKKYYNDWAFKHPTPNDFMRCAEKTSGMELEWFLTDWTQTTNTIDYGVKDAVALEGQTIVTLERIGLMPMPVEVQVLMKDGRKKKYYIPLQMMRGERPLRNNETLLEDWAWAYPEYRFTVDVNPAKIESITIDVNKETADINKENNQLKI